MLKLRNAVLTALLAFCLAMPFVSCSFNDGATGDVSNLVTEQTGNNQNGGNGGSTGGNEKPVEGTMYTVTVAGEPLVDENGEVVKIPAAALSAFAQTYGLVENTDYTISGTVITLTEAGYAKVQAAGEGGGQEPGTGDSGDVEVTEYIVKYNDRVLDTIPAADLEYYQTILLPEDYTISGNVITLTDSGFEKGKAAGFGK
ncbi:MAG: hypothetical protein MR876_07555 [Treponema porcinum]|uniref:hypothetical protein n=1 Tax=Treponema porcinum TaxID=261392 RepID=UPI0023571AA3|nr:hypothetical protein [Treponema porcinum]MCI6816402.1 hypothetical protein [Treponema porcinum]